MKITLKDFWNSKKKLAIHCDTEEKANKLLKKFDEMGKTWSNSNSFLNDNEWRYYKEETCYTNDGHYCEYEYYKEEDYTIYEFEDIDFQETKAQTNFEHYIDLIADNLDCDVVYKIMNGKICHSDNGAACIYCPAYGCHPAIIKGLLLDTYVEPTIKLTQWEYDILTTIEDQRFDYNNRNMKMKELGYFKGVTDTSMRIKDILKKALIIE